MLDADAPAPPDTPVDAGMPAWSTPVRVDELSILGLTDQDPSVTADRLEIIFASARTPNCGAGGSDLWVSTRANTGDLWSPPTCVTELSSSGYEASPEISADGLTVYFTSTRTPTLGGGDIYQSTRPDRGSPWSVPVRVAVVSTAAAEANIALSSDGQTMVIDSDQSGNRDLYLSTLSAGTWSTPVLVDAVTTSDTEGAPCLDHTGTWLYYSHGVEADQTSFDIFVSQRIAGVFGPPTLVPQINSTSQDGDPFITPDGYFYLSSTRSGDVDIYEAAPL
jgi:Tol biopolymer transport system component